MKNLISFLFFILFALLGMWWYYSCNWCLGDRNKGSSIVEEQIDTETEAKAKKTYEDSLALAHGFYAKNTQNTDVFRYPENLQINNTDFTVNIPDGIRGFENKIADYLGENQGQELTIYGYETLEEQKKDTLTGVSRANFMKDILVNAGINGDRIVTKAKLNTYDYNNDGYYNGGILLNFDKIDESRLKEIEKGIANKTLYSDFGSKDFKPDATLTNYALELKAYLNKYPDKKVLITGHTDDVGTNEGNQYFGLVRANNVKKYLVSQSIPIEKLTTESKGESNPIAPNDTDINKAKNRRIEIIVN
ncbi:OmpA family protein [uncultured Aquimarina sp.]|uniref:OmpA family protein n=1 Tax=uncultured Aquimarina sp. TaxID=575652 RepID=UPI0026255E0D|nr:OmpA family protein [uncultured Aquimarina sp.]